MVSGKDMVWYSVVWCVKWDRKQDRDEMDSDEDEYGMGMVRYGMSMVWYGVVWVR